MRRTVQTRWEQSEVRLELKQKQCACFATFGESGKTIQSTLEKRRAVCTEVLPRSGNAVGHKPTGEVAKQVPLSCAPRSE